MPKKPTVKTKRGKVRVSWMFGTAPMYSVDFGLFHAHKENQIKVDAIEWQEYLDSRIQFEIRHEALFDLITPSQRTKKRT